MGFHQSIDTDKLSADTEKAMHAPIGAASPLWWAFAGAATAGMAYWWMTRWARPVNLEAMAAPVEDALVEAAATYELVPDAIEDVAEALPQPTEIVAEAMAPVEEVVAEFTPALAAAPLTPDDLTLIAGIGPKLAASLAERGVTRFSQIAEWADEDIARLDREMKLMGRIMREAWVDQAAKLSV